LFHCNISTLGVPCPGITKTKYKGPVLIIVFVILSVKVALIDDLKLIVHATVSTVVSIVYPTGVIPKILGSVYTPLR